jgi:putative membrane protein
LETVNDLTAVDATRRTRLANERTFLAWWRTALGTQGLAVAVGKILPEIADGPHWPYVALGLVLALLGASLAAIGWWRHATVDRALHGGEEAMTPGWLVAMLGSTLAGAGAVVALLIVAT